jgi:hypothetical protein
MARRTTTSDETIGGNVFADLGLPHPEQELLKARQPSQGSGLSPSSRCFGEVAADGRLKERI